MFGCILSNLGRAILPVYNVNGISEGCAVCNLHNCLWWLYLRDSLEVILEGG